MLAPVRDALADRYLIDREIGSGGMATVYLATDRRHDRPVAIKVLRDELSQTLGAGRFSREIRVLARLRHPFILPLHDSGEAGGLLYYVMPFVDGESLGGRLRREGRLPVRDAIRITREIADALAYAHGEGVVHRDIKPENILLSRQGHALLADFGIARGRLTSGNGRDDLTAVGLTVGTPTYMSPEQGFGDTIDGRSDIYSLAITTYEMLAGRPPFSLESPVAIAIQHLTAPVPSLRNSGASVPPAIEAALVRALAKEPDGRFPTVADFAAALELSGEVPIPTTVITPPPPPSIVILPMTTSSGQKEDEYLGDGITEELIGALAKVGGIRVISRTSAFAFKGKAVPLREIGETLNVSYALEGSVRRAGERLRVTAHLIRVADDTSLWADSYERRLTDIFDVQDDITKRILSTLTRTLKITPTMALIPKSPCAGSPEAYNQYLLGRFHWNKRTKVGMERGLELFRKAIESDPNFAPAHSGIADACSVLASNGLGPQSLFVQARVAARRAVELDDSLAEGHASLGFVLMHADWQWDEAESELRRALELNPNYVPASQWLSAYLAGTGRFDEALPMATRAVETDPLSILARVNLGTVNFFGQRFEEALEHYRIALDLDPNFMSALVWMALAEARLGKADEALAHAATLGGLTGEDDGHSVLGAVYALLGRRSEAEVILAKILEDPEPYPLFVAMLHSLLGNENETFEWLERTYRERTDWIYSIASQPAFERYRHHPRFTALLERLGLPA